MKYPSPFSASKIAFIGAAFLLFAGCDSDDDTPSPPEGTTFPVTMNYYDITDAELLLWIGGEPASTEGLVPEDLLTDDDLFAMTETYYENQVFVFTADSLYSPDLSGANAYYFENDTLFGTILFGGVPIDVFVGTGDFSELRLPVSAYRYCTGNNDVLTCGSGGENAHTSFEAVVADDENLSADDFGPNDSLAVYNITVRFRP